MAGFASVYVQGRIGQMLDLWVPEQKSSQAALAASVVASLKALLREVNDIRANWVDELFE